MSKSESDIPRRERVRKGLIIVNTGEGKGKTTAALGIVLRTWGRDMRVCVVQFIKQATGNWGEIKAARRMEVEWHAMGDGFTWLSKEIDETAAKAQHAWALGQEKIASREYDLVLLDEMTYAFHYGWLEINSVIEWLKANRPSGLHLIITGRDAPPELIAFADLVTEMREVKHPYHEGIKAQPGIEF